MVIGSLPPERDKPFNTDILELFAGSAKATRLAKQYQLNALEPFEKNDGKDLKDRATQQLVEYAINKFKPLLLLAGFPCTSSAS